MCDHHSEKKKRSSCQCGSGLPVEKFMYPCLLLLLKEHSSVHGYDLIQLLPEFGFSERSLDPGSVYRNLRRMEDDGLVVSHWETGEGGPARRLYCLTNDGEEMLQAWAVHIKQQRKRLDHFLERCQIFFKT